MRAWLGRVALVAVGVVIVLLTTRPGADAGSVRYVPIGGTIRSGAHGLVVERNRTHAPRGLTRPRCVGANLRVDLRPRSRVAGWVTVSVDGAMLRAGIAAGLTSVQGGRILVGFARHGEPIGCREAFADPAGNLWVSVVQVVP